MIFRRGFVKYIYAINKLGNNITVGNDFDLEFCKQLQKMPLNLTVGNDLSLIGCLQINKLHDTMKVGREIHISKSMKDKLRKPRHLKDKIVSIH